MPSRGLYNGRAVNFVFLVFFLSFFFVFGVSHVFSFFFWYVPFILLDFPVSSDVFFTFVLFFLSCVSNFFGFCSFHFATFFVTTNVFVFCFRCFLVIFLHSRVFSSFQTCSLPFLGRPYVSFLCVFHFWHLYSHFARSSLSCPRFFDVFFHFSIITCFCDFSSLLVLFCVSLEAGTACIETPLSA